MPLASKCNMKVARAMVWTWARGSVTGMIYLNSPREDLSGWVWTRRGARTKMGNKRTQELGIEQVSS